jgi:hypothetical protein
MLRYAVAAVAVLAFGFGTARSEEFVGSIKKVEDGKITVAKFDRETKKFDEGKSYTLAKDVKVLNATFNKEEKKVVPGEPLKEGLKNERFEKIGPFGVFSQIITNNDGQVTEIRVFPPFKFKKPAD